MFQEIRTRVGQEPDLDSCNSDDIVVLKIHCCGGKLLERRFTKNDTLEELLNYIMSEGYHRNRYRVLKQFPKQNVSCYFWNSIVLSAVIIVLSISFIVRFQIQPVVCTNKRHSYRSGARLLRLIV